MQPGTDKILARAAAATARARAHLRGGAFDRAAERAYHAIVHAARALLSERGDRVRSHQAVGEHAAALDPPPPAELLEALVAARAWRAEAAADDHQALLEEEAERLVELADGAVAAVRANVASPTKGVVECSS